ncbi:MAG TPA: hypothetical protein VF913_11205 [Xanthobacteraceae bacterium]
MAVSKVDTAAIEAAEREIGEGRGELDVLGRAACRLAARLAARIDNPTKDSDPLRLADALARVCALLPPKVAAAAVESDSYPGAAVMSGGELDVLRYLVDRARRGDQVEALRVELPPLRQGVHAPGEPGCSCGICSPGRVGEELAALRSENVWLKQENEALRTRSPAAVASPTASGVGGGPPQARGLAVCVYHE